MILSRQQRSSTMALDLYSTNASKHIKRIPKVLMKQRLSTSTLTNFLVSFSYLSGCLVCAGGDTERYGVCNNTKKNKNIKNLQFVMVPYYNSICLTHLGEVVGGVAVEHHPAYFPERKVFVRPDLGHIERIEAAASRLLHRHHLHNSYVHPAEGRVRRSGAGVLYLPEN